MHCLYSLVELADAWPCGQFDERAFCRNDILPKVQHAKNVRNFRGCDPVLNCVILNHCVMQYVPESHGGYQVFLIKYQFLIKSWEKLMNKILISNIEKKDILSKVHNWVLKLNTRLFKQFL